MLAIGLFLALVVSFLRAARARHVVACTAILAAAYALAMDNANGLAWRHENGQAFEGFIILAVGPCGALGRARGAMPTSDLFVAHPALAHLVLVVIVAGVVLLLRRQSAPLRPETPRARALDAIALPLVFVVVVETSVLLLGAVMSSGSS